MYSGRLSMEEVLEERGWGCQGTERKKHSARLLLTQLPPPPTVQPGLWGRLFSMLSLPICGCTRNPAMHFPKGRSPAGGDGGGRKDVWEAEDFLS